MNETQVKELAERIRKHLVSDGSMYDLERVIENYLKQQKLLEAE